MRGIKGYRYLDKAGYAKWVTSKRTVTFCCNTAIFKNLAEGNQGIKYPNLTLFSHSSLLLRFFIGQTESETRRQSLPGPGE